MSLSRQAPRSIEVIPLTLHIGAEIRGVDLTRPLPRQQVREVREAFLKWKVVFFRDQHLDHAQHVAMARQFRRSIRSPRTGSPTKTARRRW